MQGAFYAASTYGEAHFNYFREERAAELTGAVGPLQEDVEDANHINAELESLAKTIYDYWFVQFDFPDARGRPCYWLEERIPDDLGKIVGGSTPSTADAANFGRGMIPWITPKDLLKNASRLPTSATATDQLRQRK